jgi:hypothetical protein
MAFKNSAESCFICYATYLQRRDGRWSGRGTLSRYLH